MNNKPIVLFDGTKNDFLSNFHRSFVMYEGQKYPTVEHAYQAAKVLSPRMREVIANAATPGTAKRIGQAVDLRKDWEDVKYDIMLTLLREKFDIPELTARLDGTGDARLVEGNVWHDNVWGVCVCHKCKGTIDPDTGVFHGGKNWLGLALEKVREENRKALK